MPDRRKNVVAHVFFGWICQSSGDKCIAPVCICRIFEPMSWILQHNHLDPELFGRMVKAKAIFGM